jgi:uncharacterized protein (TIGR03435 family)
MRKIWIALFSLMIATAVVIAQQPTQQAKVDTAQKSDAAAKSDASPKFELADVHVSATAAGFAQNFGGVLREGKYVNRDVTLLTLIAAAYGVPEEAVVGGPGWISSDLYDIVAKVPEGTKMATANLMLKSLLVERFGLTTHEGTYPLPRYVLSVGKGGSKLKAAASASDEATCVPKQVTFPADPNDLANFPDIQVDCKNLTSAAIGENLHNMAGGYIDHDVVDMTHLEGAFDFNLTWTPRGALVAKGHDGISVFDAVDKQLGLKLELKDVPVPGLVVDHVNRNPTANPAGASTALVLAAARFEVASIKPADPSKPPFVGLLYTGGSQMTAGGTLRQMIALALQVPSNVANDMVVGLPKSADTQAWMIEAKVPSTGEGAPQIVNGRPTPPPFSVGLEMLRGELVAQFELKTHMEDREVSVYALTVAKNNPTLKKADESERSECKPDPNAPKPFAGINVMTACKNTTMAQLAQALQQRAGAYMDHPVVDATGLEAGYDFLMGWTPRAILEAPAKTDAGASAGGVPGDPSGGISVFDAMEKELGLKLVKQKKTIPVIVVDHVDDKPVQ